MVEDEQLLSLNALPCAQGPAAVEEITVSSIHVSQTYQKHCHSLSPPDSIKDGEHSSTQLTMPGLDMGEEHMQTD